MDISKISGTVGVSGSRRQTSKGGEKGFDKILNRTMGEAQGADSSRQSTAPCVNAVAPPQLSEVGPVDGTTVRQADKILDLMDNYAKALGDPQRTLKSVEPILEQIQDEVKRLPADPSQNNTGLGNIINDIAVMASVEAIKFHRGDYVS